MIDHTGLNISNPEKSRNFYNKALAPLGYEMMIEIPKEYVTKNDLNRALETIHERFDKLDMKMDSRLYSGKVLTAGGYLGAQPVDQAAIVRSTSLIA